MKKNQNAPRPSEHPPVRGEKMLKRLGGIKGCKYKTSPLDYEDSTSPWSSVLVSKVVYWIRLYCLMMYCFVFAVYLVSLHGD